MIGAVKYAVLCPQRDESRIANRFQSDCQSAIARLCFHGLPRLSLQNKGLTQQIEKELERLKIQVTYRG
jgi:hypothetical protein